MKIKYVIKVENDNEKEIIEKIIKDKTCNKISCINCPFIKLDNNSSICNNLLNGIINIEIE